MPTARLAAADSVLVIIDIQDKLLAAVPAGPELVRDVGFIMDAAALVGVPVLATEQYPTGLGPTTADLLRRLPSEPLAKTAFSCLGAGGFLPALRECGRRSVVLVGLETHVCVLGTALDLLDAGCAVFLPEDAVSARSLRDHGTALRRLERAGVVVTSSETTAFEWVGDAAHSQFKAVSRLVVARDRSIRPANR